jgi:hypothetical protein
VAADLAWLRQHGLDAAIAAHLAADKPTLAICGGLQMLGGEIKDPHGVEAEAQGLDGRATATPTSHARRPSGRDAKRASRAARAASSIPYITRKIPYYEVSRRGRPGAHGAQRRYHSRGDRHRFSRRSRGDRDLEGGRRRRQRASACTFRAACAARWCSAPRRANSPACAQSRAQCGDRRQEHRVRSGLRLALRAQSRRRPPLRAHRGLPQFRQARLHGDLAAPFGRHDLRAGRSAGQQAPSRHGVQPSEVQRQGVHGIGDRAGARRGLRRHGEHRIRRGVEIRPPAGPKPPSSI